MGSPAPGSAGRMVELAGKRVLITGASSGIGCAAGAALRPRGRRRRARRAQPRGPGGRRRPRQGGGRGRARGRRRPRQPRPAGGGGGRGGGGGARRPRRAGVERRLDGLRALHGRRPRGLRPHDRRHVPRGGGHDPRRASRTSSAPAARSWPRARSTPASRCPRSAPTRRPSTRCAGSSARCASSCASAASRCRSPWSIPGRWTRRCGTTWRAPPGASRATRRTPTPRTRSRGRSSSARSGRGPRSPSGPRAGSIERGLRGGPRRSPTSCCWA